MSDFDASALMAVLDIPEMAGVPPELVEQFRALVVAEDCRRKMIGIPWSDHHASMPLSDFRELRRRMLTHAIVPAIDGIPLGGPPEEDTPAERPVASPLRSGLAGYLGEKVAGATKAARKPSGRRSRRPAAR